MPSPPLCCQKPERVEHRTFSGRFAAERQQPVLYVTERCVLKLGPDGPQLVEVAPGIDIDRDILAHMAFKPVIQGEPELMDARIFLPGPMGLRDDLLRVPLERRFSYDRQQNLFFINFEGHVVRTKKNLERIRKTVEAKLADAERRVYVVVNYDNFTILPDVLDEYTSMVKVLADRYYAGVTRYTTSGFLRAKLGEALSR